MGYPCWLVAVKNHAEQRPRINDSLSSANYYSTTVDKSSLKASNIVIGE